MIQYKDIPPLDDLTKFKDNLSRELAAVLSQYLIFQSQYKARIDVGAKCFVWATLSIFWKVTDQLSPPPRPDGQEKSLLRWQAHTENPIRDVVSQMNDLLMSLRSKTLTIPLDHQDLVDEIMKALCRCVRVFEEVLETYRGAFDNHDILSPASR